jgi:hypothetical protein
VDAARTAALHRSFFMDLSTRRVEIASIAAAANRLCVAQIGRNLTDAVGSIFNGKRY